MVKAGLAEVYRGTPAKGQAVGPYWKAEEEAKRQGRECGCWEISMWVRGSGEGYIQIEVDEESVSSNI
jgi:hypothetical protein